MAQRKALGRGLSALLGTPDLETDQLREADIERILPNSHQPRKNFDEDALNELANSIRAHGVIQPLVVRPVGRSTLLLARFLAAATVCAAYVLAVYGASMVITRATGGWWPDRFLAPGLGLAAGVAVIAALSLLGSVFLTSTANGIAVFMIVGAGLVGGLLGQVGEALQSSTLESVGTYMSWALPFEALYQDGLSAITADTQGLTKVIVELGPFGGAQDASPLLWLWAAGYVSLLALAAGAGFARRDL